MQDFKKEQIEILNLTDKFRYDQNVNTREKYSHYVEIVKDCLEKYASNRFQLVEFPYIENFPRRFHLVAVKKGSRPIASEKNPCYALESVAAVFEIRGSGLVNYKHKLEEDVIDKRNRFQSLKARNKDIKCLYLTLQERAITKGTDYDRLSRKHLGSDFFSLRESTTQKVNEGEWERFVKTFLTP